MRTLTLLLAFTTLVSLAGCGGKGPKEVVRQHALMKASTDSENIEAEAADLKVSIDGKIAVVTGKSVAKYTWDFAHLKGPFNPTADGELRESRTGRH